MVDIKTIHLRTEEEIISNWHDNKAIKVSVICATYNHEHFIEDAIKSFLMQKTDFAFEVIIHDDASSDATPKIVKKYELLYPNIIKSILQKENQFSQGIKPTLNIHKVTQGQYHAMCEGDDHWVEPKKLQLQYNFLESHRSVVYCGHNSTIINESNTLLYEDRWQHKGFKDYMTPCLMYRKTQLTPVFLKYFKDIKNGDIAFRYFMSLHGEFALLDFIGSAYRVHGGGIWSQKSDIDRILMSTNSYDLMLKWVVEDNITKLISEILTRKLQKQFQLCFIYLKQLKIKSGFIILKELVLQLFNNDFKLNGFKRIYWGLIAFKRALFAKQTF